MERLPAVVHAISDHRPPVVPAWQDQVDLVTALGAVLALEEISRKRVEREALRAPVAIAPDRRFRARLADERVVLRDPAIVVDAVDRSLMVREILGRVVLTERRWRLSVTHGDEEVPVAVEDEPRAIVPAGVA